MSITDRAMLARLRIRQWTARKLDKKITGDVNRQYGAAANAGNYNKLLVDSPLLAAVEKVRGQAREFHLQNTLPWLDNGARILPAENFAFYAAEIAKFKAAYDEAARAFIAAYPAIRDAAESRLGNMFRAADFPHPREVAQKFGLDPIIENLPDPNDFRVVLGNGAEEAIRQQIAANIQAGVDGAVRDLWKRLHETVAKMVERLKAFRVEDDGKRTNPFRDTLVTNISDLVDLLPRLNITRDAALDAMAARIKRELCAEEPEALRVNDDIRTRTRQTAEEIIAEMQCYIGTPDGADGSEAEDLAA